jgi:hypothetical protein
MRFYDLGPIAAPPTSPEPASVQTIAKPAWAHGLPPHATLVYIRDLGAATLVVVLGAYMAARAIRDPGAALAAIRQRTGA